MPKVIDQEKLKARILEKAHATFKEKGYQAVSLRMLASELGMTTGTIYHYFKNKDELVRAVLERSLSDSFNGFSENKIFSQKDHGSTLSEKLDRMFEDLAISEDSSLTDILLLTDFFRKSDKKDIAEQDYSHSSKFFDAFKSSMKLDDDDSVRLILPYLVGMHLIRLWTNKVVPLDEYCRVLKKYVD